MATDTRYRLMYFDLRGRAEVVRLVLNYIGEPFEDVIVHRDTWPEIRRATPLGQLPVLWARGERGDTRIPQTQAILRHLARTHGLYGATEREHTLTDVLAETVVDARGRFNPVAYAPNRLADEAVNQRYLEVDLHESLDRLAKLMRHSTVPEAGYFVTAVPTYADFAAFDFLDAQLQIWPACLESYPALLAFVERMGALPTLRGYLAERRPSDFRR